MLSVRISTCRCSIAKKSVSSRTLFPGLMPMRPSWPRHVTSSLRHGLRALMLLWETAMRKWPKVHTVQGTRDFSQNCSGCMCSKLPGLKLRIEDKMAAKRSWELSAHLHRFLWKHTPRYIIDWLRARMLLLILTQSLRNSKWRSSLSIWLAGMSRDWARISQSSK